jgi:flagellar biosynthesis protein FliQ
MWLAMWIASAGGMHREEVPWVGFQVVLYLGLPATIICFIVGLVMSVRTARQRRNAPTEND